jgi:8-oxo-dGTP pyrophosphatase MutT (NUDIX family)
LSIGSHFTQYAALPWPKRAARGLADLDARTESMAHPEGLAHPKLDRIQTASREAWEEAGVIAEIIANIARPSAFSPQADLAPRTPDAFALQRV